MAPEGQKPMTFCGFEIKKGPEGEVVVTQKSYAEELTRRHGIKKARPTPMSSSLVIPEEPEDFTREQLREAQAVTGELLWLSIRSRPDLSYVTGLMGRMSTKNPVFVCQVGQEAMEYIYGTLDVGLVYGPLVPDFGPEDCLPFARSMTRVEVFADVSFAPQSSKSVQGVIGLYGGAPIQWLSKRQGCLTLSTAESELLSYIEAMSVADAIGCIISILEEIPIEFDKNEDDEDEDEGVTQAPDEDFAGGGEDQLQRVIYGDNQAAVSVLSSPDGPWRTRHLRLRSHVLRQRLQHKLRWAVRHLPGALLSADHLTKAVNPRARWKIFFDFMRMVRSTTTAPVVNEDTTQVKALVLKNELTKIAAAGLGAVALATLIPKPGTDEEIQKGELMSGLSDYIREKIERLERHGRLGGLGTHGESKRVVSSTEPQNQNHDVTSEAMDVLSRDLRVGRDENPDWLSMDGRSLDSGAILETATGLLRDLPEECHDGERWTDELPQLRAVLADDGDGECECHDGRAPQPCDGVCGDSRAPPPDGECPGDRAVQFLGEPRLQGLQESECGDHRAGALCGEHPDGDLQGDVESMPMPTRAMVDDPQHGMQPGGHPPGRPQGFPFGNQQRQPVRFVVGPPKQGVPGVDYSLDLGPMVKAPTPVSEFRPLYPGEPPPYLGVPGSEIPEGFPFHHYAKQFWPPGYQPPTMLNTSGRPVTGTLVRPTFSVNMGPHVRPPPPRPTTNVDAQVQLVMQMTASEGVNEGCAPAATSKSEGTKSKSVPQPVVNPGPKMVPVKVESSEESATSGSSTSRFSEVSRTSPDVESDGEDREEPEKPVREVRRDRSHGRAAPLCDCECGDARAGDCQHKVYGGDRALQLLAGEDQGDCVCLDHRAWHLQEPECQGVCVYLDTRAVHLHDDAEALVYGLAIGLGSRVHWHRMLR